MPKKTQKEAEKKGPLFGRYSSSTKLTNKVRLVKDELMDSLKI